MGPILNGLVKLQSIENRLRAVKAKLVRCRRKVVIQENQIGSLRNTLEAKKEDVQLTKIQADRLELELKTRDEAISKLRVSLNAAKTSRDYAAILTQLNTTKADNSKTESQLLDLLKVIETDEAECKNIDEEIEQQKTELEKTRKDSETLAVKYEAEMEQIDAEWKQKAEQIPPEVLEVFKRVADTYDGEALAVIEKQQGKSQGYTCCGCFMGVTAESVNVLLTRDDIIRCPICTRILVLDQSEG